MTTPSFLSQPGVRVGRGVEAAPALRIAAPPHPVLIDDPRGVVITGCEPCSPVVVQARVEIDNATREARASFRADESGTVDTGRDASLAGTYTGVDPFGLWWSGDLVSPSARSLPSPVSARLHVEAGDRTAEATTERLWLAPGATMSEVREPGVWGLFARPAGPGPFPAVVAFGGSGGGLGPAAAWGPALASARNRCAVDRLFRCPWPSRRPGPHRRRGRRPGGRLAAPAARRAPRQDRCHGHVAGQ